MRRPVRFGILDFGFLIILATTIIASACDPSTGVKPPASPSPAATATPASPVVSPSPIASVSTGKVDSLVGRWPGAEGTYLTITKKGEKYSVEIAGLGGPKTFEGTAKGDVIEFTRNSKTETIKAGSGVDTGMKGFEKETNCVVVTKGSEAFCKK